MKNEVCVFNGNVVSFNEDFYGLDDEEIFANDYIGRNIRGEEFDNNHFDNKTKEYVKKRNEQMDSEINDFIKEKIRSGSRRKETKTFNTYLIIDKGSGLYKIGKSVNVQKRLKSLKVACPMIELVGSYGYDIESQLHKRFEAKNVTGEWFSLNESDIECIESEFSKAE